MSRTVADYFYYLFLIYMYFIYWNLFFNDAVKDFWRDYRWACAVLAFRLRRREWSELYGREYDQGKVTYNDIYFQQ